MKLGLVDAGNSRIKAALSDGEGYFERTAIFDYSRLDELRSFITAADVVAVSSVKSAFDPSSLGKRVMVITFDNSLVPLNYSRTLGSDRIAKAHFIRYAVGELSLIIDFGTATVVDLIGREFYGGVILPGAGLWLSSLGSGADLLPDVRLREARRNIGNTTDEAILSGLFESMKAIIEHFRRTYPHRRRFATGGFYGFYSRYLHDFQYEPFAVLRGLYEWVKRI